MPLSGTLEEHAARERADLTKDPVRKCKICGAPALAFDTVDFNKTCAHERYFGGKSGIPVVYMRCASCGFIFTTFTDRFAPDDFERWIYNDDYIRVDPDFADYRPALNVSFVESMFMGRKNDIVGLDYGGGKGLTSALLRSGGWNYDCFDPFGITDFVPANHRRYNVCTAFEVFEHLPNPVDALAKLLALVSPGPLVIAIGTHLSDEAVDERRGLDWWYAAPRNGHISLFSSSAMCRLAADAGLKYYQPRPTLHLLTRKMSVASVRLMTIRYFAIKALQRLYRGPCTLNRTGSV